VALTLTLGAAQGASGTATAAPKATQVVLKLKSSGLPIGKYKTYSASTDPNHLLGRQGQYTGKVNFRDARLKDGLSTFDVSAGGSIEVFKSRSDALRRFKYVKAVTQSSSFLVEYDYLEGLVFLRLSSTLTPAQAKKYEAALRRLF